jgi:HAE1 family hydrophobic/amphiphilic exporter-1
LAVLLSLFVSFTLTPMLSARFLGAHHGEPRGLSGLIERALVGLETGYRRLVRGALRHRIVTLGVAVATLVGTLMLLPRIGFEFMPVQDTGQFNVKLDLPPGTSLAATEQRAGAIATRIREVPGVRSTFTTIGGGDQGQTNAAEIVVSLVPKAERSFHQTEAMAHIRAILAGTPRAILSVEPLTAVGGGQRNAMVQLDLRGPDLDALAASATAIADRMRAAGGFVDVDTTARPGKPEIEVAFDRQRAADVGVQGFAVARTVRGLIAGEVATEFESGGERYDVRVQLPARPAGLGRDRRARAGAHGRRRARRPRRRRPRRARHRPEPHRPRGAAAAGHDLRQPRRQAARRGTRRGRWHRQGAALA